MKTTWTMLVMSSSVPNGCPTVKKSMPVAELRIFTIYIFPHTLVEHVLYANIFLFVYVLLHSKCHNSQTVKNNPNGNGRIKGSTMQHIIDCKRSDDSSSDEKLYNAENNAIQDIVNFDSVYHCYVLLQSTFPDNCKPFRQDI